MTASSANCSGSNWTATCRRRHIDPYASPYTKLDPLRIKDINIIQDTMRLMGENIKNSLELIGTRRYFLKRTELAQGQR